MRYDAGWWAAVQRPRKRASLVWRIWRWSGTLQGKRRRLPLGPYIVHHCLRVVLAAERHLFAALVLAEQTQREQKTRDQGVYK